MRHIAKKELKIYTLSSGKQPFIEWLSNLKDAKTQHRIEARLDRLAFGAYGDCKPVGQGVFELRLFFGAGYRIYFSERGEEIILLLCGGDKSSQTKDIQKAQEYLQDAQGEKYAIH